MKSRALLLSFALVAAPHLVLAQTPAGYPPLPPSTPSGPTTRPVSPPVPSSVVNQAEAQAQGQFTAMDRASVGGQVQTAWDNAEETAGVFRYPFCGTCTYKVRLREHMVTVIELPEGETIEKADVGDGKSFDVQQRGPRRLAVKPKGYGIDTNLMIYGVSGTVYPIYLRAESFNSVNVSDLMVRIEGAVSSQEIEVAAITTHVPVGADSAQADPVDGIPPLTVDEKSAVVDGLNTPDPNRAEGDFVQEAPFDPDKLRGWGDYKLWAGGPDGEGLRPETVFRDDHFTYIRFGDKWKDVELPTAYVVVDGVDELVNTRVQGRTYIIESTHKLITLKSGKSFMCIEYGGAS